MSIRSLTKPCMLKLGAAYSTGIKPLSDYEKMHKNPLVKTQKMLPKAHYGGRHTVTMLPGAGLGPEMMGHVKKIFSYIGAPVDFEVVEIDYKSENEDDVRYAINTIKRNGVALKGNIETRSRSALITSWNVLLRNELDLFTYFIRCMSYQGLRTTKHKNVDIISVRQNTEGEYSMLEHESVDGVVESMKVITRSNSERVARFAFEYAKAFGRKKVTTVHKANIMKIADGLFLETSRKIAKEYPDIEHNDIIIDNCCMQLVAKPHQFDVLLMTNLYGSVVNNVLCGMLGGAGVYAGRNYGYNYAVFEPGTRHTGNHLVGKNVANPVAMISASIAMLDHLGHIFHADLLRRAVDKTINEDWIVTKDCGGKASTTDVVKAIIDNCSVVSEQKGSKK